MSAFRSSYRLLESSCFSRLCQHPGSVYSKLSHTNPRPPVRWVWGKRNIEPTRKGNLAPVGSEEILGASRGLLRPVVFTVLFSTASFGGASIWQYEDMRQKALRQFNQTLPERFRSRLPKAGELRQQIHSWWQSQTNGQQVALCIIAANVLVFVAWRIPALQTTLVKYFTSDPSRKIVCLPMVLSTFSHHSLWHLAANMYVLYSFSSVAGSLLGREQLLAFYLTAGVTSSLASYMYKTVVKKATVSLGASGAIMGLLGLVCTHLPDSQLNILFLPAFTFSAGIALKTLMAVDSLGLVMRWKLFDHAAHLGGALLGICYAHWGQKEVWAKRGSFIVWWHELRGNPTRPS